MAVAWRRSAIAGTHEFIEEALSGSAAHQSGCDLLGTVRVQSGNRWAGISEMGTTLDTVGRAFQDLCLMTRDRIENQKSRTQKSRDPFTFGRAQAATDLHSTSQGYNI